MNETLSFGTIGSWKNLSCSAPKGAPFLAPPRDQIYRMVDRPLGYADGRLKGTVPDSFGFIDGRDQVEKIMQDIDSLFLRHLSYYNREYLQEGGFRHHFLTKIKQQPAFLHHVVFWGVASDVDCVTFEWYLFQAQKILEQHRPDIQEQHLQKCQNMLHGLSYDLSGHLAMADPKGSWYALIHTYGCLAAESRILELHHEPDAYFVDYAIDYSDCADNIVRTGRELLGVHFGWPLLVQPDHVCHSIAELAARTEADVEAHNAEHHVPGEFFIKDHSLIVEMEAWHTVHVRVYYKKVRIF